MSAELSASEQRVRRYTLIATILGSAIGFLDATVLSVALPTMASRHELHFGLAGKQWVNLSYTLALVALYLLAGAVGDRYGQRRMFVAGTVAFAAASLLAGLAPSLQVLLVARVLQGAAGAFLTTSSLALLRNTFGSDSGHAIGKWTSGTSIATVAGPFVGGAITQYVSWRLIFLMNLPVAIAAVWFALACRARREPVRREPAAGLDWIGAALAATWTATFSYFLVAGGEHGFAREWAYGAVAGVTFVAFLVRERGAEHPLLPLWLFARRNFAAANVATLLIYASLGGSMFFLGLYLQSRVVGMSPVVAGLWGMPLSLALILLAPYFGRQADARGPRLFLAAGPMLMAVGMACFLLIDRRDPLHGLAEGMVAYALGLAMVVAPITATALRSAPERHSGVAAAVNTALARFGAVVAVAAMGAVIAGVYASHAHASATDDPFATDAPSTHRDAAVAAYRAGMLVAIGLALAGAVTAAIGIDNDEARRAAGGRDAAPQSSTVVD